jgi:translation initiation factor 3 subunit B
MSLENGYKMSEEEERDFQAEIEEGFAEIEQKCVDPILIHLKTPLSRTASRRVKTRRLTCRYAVDTQQGFENVLVIDNTPIVDESKKDKLLARLRSEFSKAGAPLDEDRIQMPWDDAAGTNKG